MSVPQTLTPAFSAVAYADAPIATDERAGVRFLSVASVESDSSWFQKLLRGSSGFRGLLPVTLVKAVNATSRIDELLLAREKRMTSGTDFYV